MKVRKAIIPAAGFGTRFLPATKSVPKEMIPIVDKPTIQYVVEEAAASGIEQIYIILGRGKNSIEDHFDKSFELEELLKRKSKLKELQEIEKIANLCEFSFIRQNEPKGLGHAVLKAKNFIGNEPFAVLLGDDIVISKTPLLKEMIDVFQSADKSVLAVQHVPDEDTNKYGIIKSGAPLVKGKVLPVESLVEKPERGKAPSNFGIIGRYILKPDIFPILENTKIGQDGELQLTDAINELNKTSPVLAYVFAGKRYDIGNKNGFVKATIDFALNRPDTKNEIYTHLQQFHFGEKGDPD